MITQICPALRRLTIVSEQDNKWERLATDAQATLWIAKLSGKKTVNIEEDQCAVHTASFSDDGKATLSHGHVKSRLRCKATATSGKKGIMAHISEFVKWVWNGPSATSADGTGAASPDPARWFVQASGGKEFPCDADVARRLEAEFNKASTKRGKVAFKHGTQSYECDLNAMEQRNVATKKVRKLRREAASPNATTSPAPVRSADQRRPARRRVDDSDASGTRPGVWSADVGGGSVLEYPEAIQALLEAEWRKAEGQRQPVRYVHRSQSYKLDVALMKQINTGTDKKRPMYRKQPKE